MRNAYEILTNYIKHSPPWEANNQSAGQEIPLTFMELEVFYLILMTPPPPPMVPILSQMNSVRNFPHYFPKIYLPIYV
jgi:hypothetical protein